MAFNRGPDARPSAMQHDSHVSLGNIKNSANFLGFPLLNVAQQDDRLLGRRQCLQGFRRNRKHFTPGEFPFWRDTIPWCRGRCPTAIAPETISIHIVIIAIRARYRQIRERADAKVTYRSLTRLVDDDARDPGAQRGQSGIGIKARQHRDPGILDDFLGRRVIPAE